MGVFDRILGRTKPVAPNLDALFAVPEAAVTLETAAGFRPTGVGSVCYRGAEGGAFDQVQSDVRALLDADDGPQVELTADPYGYTWLTARHDAGDLAGLVTDLHAVNSSLVDGGFGAGLLCSLIGFVGAGDRRLGLVYLAKRGTFYPFAPLADERRDNALELQVRAQLPDLAIEPDLSRWFAVWGAPGL